MRLNSCRPPMTAVGRQRELAAEPDSCHSRQAPGFPRTASGTRRESTLPATTGRTGSRKIASPPTGLRGTADVGRRPFAGSKSRKQPLDACRRQRPVDCPLLTTSNGHCRPVAELQALQMPAGKRSLTGSIRATLSCLNRHGSTQAHRLHVDCDLLNGRRAARAGNALWKVPIAASCY